MATTKKTKVEPYMPITGEKVIMMQSPTYSAYVGYSGKVTGIYEKGSSSVYIYVSLEGVHGYPQGYAVTLYPKGKDRVAPATRENKAILIQQKIDNQQHIIDVAKNTIEGLKMEKEQLLKYKTEEDFVAAKLSAIMKSKGDEKAIAKVLKTMKESHYL